MTNAVLLPKYYETQLKQLPFYARWAKMIQSEVPYFFPKDQLVEIDCSGCGDSNVETAFEKLGFTYKHCLSCNSLFVSPRPTEKALKKFYKRSRAMRFWKDKIVLTSPHVQTHREISPLTYWISANISKNLADKKIETMDYRPCITTTWDTEKLERNIKRLTLLEPVLFRGKNLSFQREVRVTSENKTPHKKMDLITAFGLLEREFSPQQTIGKIASLCRKGALLLLTTNTTGFEYQTLGEHSYRIVPPYRLNVLSIEAIKNILKLAGFELTSLSTPGKLDVSIVGSIFKRKGRTNAPEFLRYLFGQCDAQVLESFQDFLQLANLSSHLRIAARKL